MILCVGGEIMSKTRPENENAKLRRRIAKLEKQLANVRTGARANSVTARTKTDSVARRTESKRAQAAQKKADTGARKRARQAQQYSQQTLQHFIDSSPHTSYLLDLVQHTGELISQSEFLGYSKQELQMRDSITAFIHPDDQAAVIAYWQDITSHANAASAILEYRIQHKLGHWEWVRQRHSVVESAPDGSPIKLLLALTIITEQKAAEQVFARFFDMVPDLVCIASVDGYFIQVNREWERVLGYTQAELLNTPFLEFIHPEDRDATMQQVQRQLKNQAVISFINRYRARDGTYRWLEWNALPAVDGKTLYAAARDITEHKQMEQVLQKRIEQATAELQDLYDNAPCGYHALDANGVFVRINRTELNWLGYTRQEVIGHPLAQILTPAGAADFQANYLAFQQSGQRDNLELEFVRKDGTRFPALVNARALYDEHGKYVASRTTLIDMTERKQSELEHQRITERLKLATNAADIGIWDWDIVNNLVVWDEQMYHLYGVRADTFGGAYDAWLNSIHPQDRAAADEINERARRGEVEYDTEFRVVRSDGSIHWLKANGQVFRDERGEPVRMLGVNYDITLRKQAEQERENLLREVERGREQLLTLSRRLIAVQEEERRALARELHDEIGQALTAIKINLQTMQREPGAAPAAPLQTSIDTIENTLSQVRQLSLDLHPSLLDDLGLVPALRWYIDHHTQNIGIQALLNVQALTTLLPAEIELVCFRVAQEALTNVLRHARAHQIRVELWEDSAELHLMIRDDGCGFDTELARARALRGETLGLVGMQERVELAGGYLEIESAPGFGAEIHAHLPLGDKGKTSERRSDSR